MFWKRNIIKKIYSAYLIFLYFFLIKSSLIAGPDPRRYINYREEMRKFVILISTRSREYKSSFIVIPQNALELIKKKEEPAELYISSIDGIGCEELYYGFGRDGRKTPQNMTSYYLKYLTYLQNYGKKIFVIDYVVNRKQAVRSYLFSKKYDFISAQTGRSLSKIPLYRFNYNRGAVTKLAEAGNFLYLLNPARYGKAERFVSALKKTDWDILIIDAFFHNRLLTEKQVELLKTKSSGKRRLVIAYLSIGEAENYRYYWKKKWSLDPPPFLERENPHWKGNFKVRYWLQDWKKIISGTTTGEGFEESYLNKILSSGFDGVYLDIVDGAFYFEKKNKIITK